MKLILESILVAAAASASGFLLCAMLGLAWHAAQPRHEADAPPSFTSFPSVQQLEIPPDREFTDLEASPKKHDNAEILRRPLSPPMNAEIPIPIGIPIGTSSFPADADYQITNPKRF